MEKSTVAEKKSSRNGGIELMRFVFAVVIVAFHGWQKFLPKMGFSFFPFIQGRIACEFFFVVSGFLMASHIAKKNRESMGCCTPSQLGKETAGYIVKKYLGVAKYLIPTLVIIFIMSATMEHWSILKTISNFIYSIPSFFLVHELFPTPYVINDGHIWYLSAMLIAMAVLYPLGRKTGSLFNCIIAPVLAAFCYVSIYNSGTYLTAGDKLIYGVLNVKLLRGLAGVSLGCVSYEIYDIIKKKQCSHIKRVGITAAECALYGLILLYACFNYSKMSYIAAVAIMLAVVLTFSEQSLLTAKLNSSKICFLGKLALPTYLVQRIPLTIITKMKIKPFQKYFLFIVSALVMGVVLMLAVEWVNSIITARKQAKKAAASGEAKVEDTQQ